MKLHQHPEFEQAILAAAEHFKPRGLRASFIEKDYYVTEALRAIAEAAGDKVIFKGGTSLSKGWNLIERFSEDIDLFLDPVAFTPPLGTNAIDRNLKRLRDAVTARVPLAFVKDQSRTFGGLGRNDQFAYKSRFAGAGDVAPRVLLESGIASGREPTATVELRSFLGQFLTEASRSLGAEDEGQFAMRLLHFRRTFVEKLFAIHKKVELFKRDGTPVGGHARHYYDLYQLAGQEEVRRMLQTEEYDEIKTDYDRISREYFPEHYFYPDQMRFANSEAIFPEGNLAEMLGAEYRRQCEQLCYVPFPEWREVLGRFDGLRDRL
ncbi:MAG: nucleotidyl transferase AbiEii/AbiGii toxin family protein [Phycisphaerales bacterium]